MALILDNGVSFLHVPKTGGTYARTVFNKLGIVNKELRGPSFESKKSIHTILDSENTVCLVRNPIEWYQSYWVYKTYISENRWNMNNQFDKKCHSGEFNGFIENVIQNYPNGFLNKFFAEYTQGCEFIGRYEELHNSLLYIVNINRTNKFKLDDVVESEVKVGSRNSSYIEQIRYRDENLQSIRDIERETMLRYGYEQPEIYIDSPMRGYSHMIGRTIPELHEFANSMGIKRAWFENKRGKQRPHYDIKAGDVSKAIKMGAKPVERKEIIKLLNKYYNG